MLNYKNVTKTTQQLADEYAKQQTVNTANDTQSLLNQYEKIAQQQQQALQQQQQLSTNQINAQRNNVMQTYNDNARQAYINSMLGKKSVEQELSQAGLNTSGLLGSAYSNVENAYGNTLAGLQKNRDNSINDINKQLNEAQLQYAIKQSELLSNIENSKLELQKYGNELAYKKYQDALSNYMNFSNYDYQKERDQVADNQWLQELKYKDNRDKVADEQWRQEMAYQKARDLIADDQWFKQYDLQKKKTANGTSSSSRSSSSLETGSYGGFTDSPVSNIDTASNSALTAGANLALYASKAKQSNSDKIYNYVDSLIPLASKNPNLVQISLDRLVSNGQITQDERNEIISIINQRV